MKNTNKTKNSNICKCNICKLQRPLKSGELQKVAEHWQRELFFKRRGKVCEMCGKEASCLDHCFSRTVRQLFFDKDNLTIICDGCHFKKTNGYDAMQLKIYDYVCKKAGEKKFKKMWAMSIDKKPFQDWGTLYLNKKIAHFKKNYNEKTQ